ncbi:MFS transporter [Dankookia rubra]|uniref:MFS transporter n=1 Tax=Dankookia rubra TaxID=1442381 RepID=A0A4R5QDV8_9PROT|nr:MFS transporter [Dankookia rubra]TDH61364.1 MFS transporter [Dankookia rubra]
MTPRDTADPAPASMTPAELRAAFLRSFPGIAPAIIIAAIDQTIVATALPAIAGSLGAVERISWVVVAWLIAATIAAPVFGRLGDAHGRRRMLFVALGIQAAGALVSATAPSFAVLIGGRLLQGFGGGGLATLAMALIAEAVPPRERGQFQAYIVASFTTASLLGPLLGGWLAQGFGWRGVFWAMLPLSALAWGLALRIPARPGSGGGGFRLDVAGVVLFAAFVTPALLALQAAQRMTLAGLPLVLGLAALAGLALALLLRQERRARDPLLPLGLLAEPTILRSNLLTGCAHGALVGLVTFLPIWLQSVRGLPPAAAGLMLLPLSLGGAMGGLTAGRLMTRTGLGMPIAGFGLALAAVALLGVAWLAPVLPQPWLALLFVLVSFGTGCSYPTSQITVQVAAGPAWLGAAAGSVQFSRTLGAAIATTLLGALLFGTLAAGDPEAAALFARLVREGPALLPGLAEAERETLREGLTTAFRAAFGGAALLVAAGSWLAWRVPVQRI